MRATLWIAASGFLLASGSAYACSELPVGHDDTVHTAGLTEASPPPVDVIIGQGPQRSAHDVAKTQPAKASPQEQAGPRLYPVTVDLDHPGGEFPVGG